MSLIIGNENLRYGSLAQANTYYDLACVPTSFTNAFLALNLDTLMQDPSRPGSWESLDKTRNFLAEDYFYTSREWGKETNNYWTPVGTLPAHALKGTLDYISQRDLSNDITLTAAGYTKEEFNGININFAGFDVTANINGVDTTSPSQKDFSKIFQELKPGESANIQDFLMQGLLRGPLVFGMYYTDSIGGHAVTATQITIDDSNANGILEKNENSYIYFIDPLNPGITYNPSIGSIVSEEEFNKIQTTNAPLINKAKIWQDYGGYLMLEYDQKSLRWSNGGTIELSAGDSSNKTSTTTTTAAITIAASLSTSGLASDFDQQAGFHSASTPGLIDFSFLLEDPTSQNKSLNGYAYSNESSKLKNEFLYYECLDISGTISVKDPLTGASSFLEPGDPEYASTAWSLAQSFSKADGALTLGARESNDTESLTPFSISLRDLTTGYIAPITQNSSGELWSIFSEANRDSQQHYQSTGNMSWRMEDLYELGDKDFTDLHVSILIESMS